MADIADPAGGLQHRVSSSLLGDQVHDTLRRWIVNGDWQPGKRLRIREVAQLVGTSEMPVREAFRRLEQAALIVVEPYKGATVRALSVDELEQIYDMRIILEAEAARLGAGRANEKVVAAMEHHWDLLQAASERGHVAEAVAQDEKLLDALYLVGGNEVLIRLVHELWDSCRPYKSLWVINAVEHGLSAWGHITQLLDAVARKDSTAAHFIMQQTYRDARATVWGLLDTQSGHASVP